ncbi:MAG TPA: ABC transporter substrate-binding protein [Candidatus Lustribacter sp.]|nr:ABC transporter substrate-binding protein [Candidatus Lustribacter sp.]
MASYRMSRSSALATIGAAASVLGSPHGARAQTASATDISIGVVLAEPYMEPYYADSLGFFKRAGLNPNIQVFPNASITLQAVVGNALAIGTANLIQLASAFNRGVDVTIVAAGGMFTSDQTTIPLCVSKNSPIQSAKDLEGQTVSVTNLAGTEGIAVSEWLKAGGADPQRVKIFEIPFAQVAPALARGTVAAGLLGEPFTSEYAADVRAIGYPYAAIAPAFYTGVWVARRAYLAAHGPVARKLVATLYATAGWANTHKADAAALFAKMSKRDLSGLLSQTRIPFGTSLDVRYAQPLLDKAFAYKLLDRPVNAKDLFWT